MSIIIIIIIILNTYRLGLLSDTRAVLCGSPLKTLSAHLGQTLCYEDGDMDSIYLNNSIGIKWPDNTVSAVHVSYYYL